MIPSALEDKIMLAKSEVRKPSRFYSQAFVFEMEDYPKLKNDISFCVFRVRFPSW